MEFVMRKLLKKYPKIYKFLRVINKVLLRYINPLKIFYFLKNYTLYLIDIARYFSRHGSENLRLLNLYPCIDEKTSATPLDIGYFYQDTWAAGKIFNKKPKYHMDVGSTALLVGILSKFTKVCSVEIRPLL